MKRQTCLMILMVMVLAGSVSGQIIFGQPASGNPQFVYSHWTLTDVLGNETTISQSYLPIAGFVPLRDNLEATIFIANSSSAMEVAGLENTVSGLTDARIQVSQALSNDRILISGGLNLPTGKTKLDFVEEWGVIELLSQDFLDFPVRRLGEGFGFNLLVGGATKVGDFRVGGGAMYRYAGEYQPYEQSGDYDPGDVFSVNGGGDLHKGSMTWSANIVYTAYATDKLDGVKTFKQSQQLALSASGVHKGDPVTISGWISWIGRGNNTFYDTTETILSELKLYGDEFTFGAAATFELSGDWRITPSAKLRLISENEISIGSSDVIALGMAAGKNFNENISAQAGFTYFSGSAYDDLIDLSGYQLSFGLLAAF
ncbi:MAG: hypothetical protein JSU74_09100 [Candidatus Zixiibacteriota bacterium]|nr:MAG: hypothetical protein JSU74_09100 [candidate division Zixibacteria bacterium]